MTAFRWLRSGGELIGYVWAQDLGAHLRQGGVQVRVHDLFVREDIRRRGAGLPLFEAAFAWARERGAWWIEWQASAAAVPFYERLGYRGEAWPDPEHPYFEILDEAAVPPEARVP